MNIIIDIGNTMVKVAIMQGDKIIEQMRSVEINEIAILNLAAHHGARRGIISSTRGDMQRMLTRLRVDVPGLILLDGQTPLPIDIQYNPPSSLGRDRVAAAIGGQLLYPNRNLLIIDLGTAITIDLVTLERGFEGGTISPGLMCRFRALHEQTATLPLCAPTDREVEIPTTTREAIEQGVMRGVYFEIEGNIEQHCKNNDNLLIIFTGGDAIYFEKRIKNAIFANRDILLRGLNRILEYNAD